MALAIPESINECVFCSGLLDPISTSCPNCRRVQPVKRDPRDGKSKLMLDEREPLREGDAYARLSGAQQLSLMETCRGIDPPPVVWLGGGWEWKRGSESWQDLMTFLGLDIGYAHAVAEALKETAWRTAREKGRRLYLRNAAMRIGKREFGIEPVKNGQRGIHLDELAALDYYGGTNPDKFGRTSYHPKIDHVEEKDELAASTPNRLTVDIGYGSDRWDIFDARALPFRHQARGEDGKLSPNIASVKPELKSLGFNDMDIRVFVMRLDGKTRDDVISAGTTSEEKAALATAWNRLTQRARMIQREVHRPKGALPPPKQHTTTDPKKTPPLLNPSGHASEDYRPLPGYQPRQQKNSKPVKPPLKLPEM
jgi:hypothetical protein